MNDRGYYISAVLKNVINRDEMRAVYERGFHKNNIRYQVDYHKELINIDDVSFGRFIDRLYDWSFQNCIEIAKNDGQYTDRGCYANVFVRALTGAVHSQFEEWHIDGSYITVVIDLLGKGTDIAMDIHTLPKQTLLKDYSGHIDEIYEGDVLFMSGGQRTVVPATVHRAPYSENPRLVFLMFFNV